MAAVTIRYAPTGETREIDETAVPFFPGWAVVPANAGAKADRGQSTPTPSKES